MLPAALITVAGNMSDWSKMFAQIITVIIFLNSRLHYITVDHDDYFTPKLIEFMEFLTYPKTDYVLQVSLSDLHTQSIEWTKEIDFFKEEILFFYKSIQCKEMQSAFPSNDKARLEKELVAVNGDDLKRLRDKLRDHERVLSLLHKGSIHQEEQKARQEHAELHGEVNEIYSKIRNIKKQIFEFVHKN